MHLLESFALVSGSKIDRPHVSMEYFPIPFEKYVVVHSGSENPSRIYDHFNDVIYHCLPSFEKEGIQIVQIGGPNDELLEHVYDARGSSKRQMIFILNNALALMGNDTCSSHFASAVDTKLVVLHAALYPQNSRPYWSKAEDLVLIEADRDGKKPSFAYNESPKTINNIKPENVAASLLDLIGVEHDCHGFETVHLGKVYKELAFDVIPDVEFCLPKYEGCVINVRLDIVDGYKFLPSWFNHADLNLIIKDTLDIDILKAHKEKIFQIQLDARTNLSPKEVESIFNLGVPVNFFVKECDDKEYAKLALKWFDYHITRSTHDPINQEADYEYFFTSRKMYVGAKGTFLTVSDYYANILSTSSYKPIQNDPKFWEDKEHYRIIKVWKNNQQESDQVKTLMSAEI